MALPLRDISCRYISCAVDVIELELKPSSSFLRSTRRATFTGKSKSKSKNKSKNKSKKKSKSKRCFNTCFKYTSVSLVSH